MKITIKILIVKNGEKNIKKNILFGNHNSCCKRAGLHSRNILINDMFICLFVYFVAMFIFENKLNTVYLLGLISRITTVLHNVDEKSANAMIAGNYIIFYIC